MKKCKSIVTAVLVLFGSFGWAQKISSNSEQTRQEFSGLQQLYAHLPVQLSIRLERSATPFTSPEDTLSANMEIYYDYHHFYLQTEGLEEIINDSVIVLVNHQTKQILLNPNSAERMAGMVKSITQFLPDSLLEGWERRFTSAIQEIGKGTREVELRSKQCVSTSGVPQETIRFLCSTTTHQPIQFTQTKVSLLPVDSSVYQRLMLDASFNGRLIRVPSKKGTLFFLMKEKGTTYTFKKIGVPVGTTPVMEQNRVVREGDGSYRPSKGYEEYVITKDF